MAIKASKNNNDVAGATVIMNKKRTTQGRKKIEIKKIDNVSHRHVTFSKRRLGLFKKASEICILTGAEAAIIVQSSSNRVYTLGHPSIEAVIDRHTNGRRSPSCPTVAAIDAVEMREFNLEYNQMCDELKAEKKKLEIEENAKSGVNDGGNSFWWDEPIDHLAAAELEQYAAALEELRKNLLTKADDLNQTNHQNCSTSSPSIAH